MALNRFGQIDTTSSYLGGGPPKRVFPGASGNTGLGALTTGSRVHLSESSEAKSSLAMTADNPRVRLDTGVRSHEKCKDLNRGLFDDMGDGLDAIEMAAIRVSQPVQRLKNDAFKRPIASGKEHFGEEIGEDFLFTFLGDGP